MLLRPRRHRSRTPIGRLVLLLVLGLLSVGLLVSQLPAQSAASRDFTAVYLVGADTLGLERITMTDSTLVGDMRMRGQPALRWTQSLREPSGTRTVRFAAWAPNTATSGPPMQDLTLQLRGDSAYVYAPGGASGGTPQMTLAARAGAMWLVNPSVVHSAWIAQTVAPADTAWVMLAMGAQLLPAPIARGADTTSMNIGGANSHYGFDANGALQWATIPAQRLVVHMVRGADAAAVNRVFDQVASSGAIAAPKPAVAPSYDAPPNAPYTAQTVRVATPMGHTLVGTLTRPSNAGARVPVVVTITGSGAQERDEALAGVEGYRLLGEIADTLGRRGIGVLRLDDRGIGASGGNFATATSHDFADDIRAAVAWLRTRDDVDPTRIGLVGHSEGGLVAPMLAADDPKLAAIALLAGPAYTGRRVVTFQQRSAIDERFPSSSPSEREAMLAQSQVETDALASGNPWLREFLRYDPVPTARRVTQIPVLILQGDTDQQVTAEQADTLAAAFREGGNRNVTMHRLRDTNHLFQRDPSGLASGYATLPDRRVTTEMLGLLADWLSRTLNAR